jgi:hypothetical protein
MAATSSGSTSRRRAGASGQPWDAAAIYVVKQLGDPPRVYATSQQLGLQRGYAVNGNLLGDDIDALAISDFVTPGTFQGNEIIWISLDIAPPTRPRYLRACDGIIQVNPPQPPVGMPPVPPALRGIVIMPATARDMSARAAGLRRAGCADGHRSGPAVQGPQGETAMVQGQEMVRVS